MQTDRQTGRVFVDQTEITRFAHLSMQAKNGRRPSTSMDRSGKCKRESVQTTFDLHFVPKRNNERVLHYYCN